MDYEKEYKKLKADILNAYLFAHTDSTKAVLEHILPELRESEDLEEAARKIATRHSHITGDTYYANDAWFFKKGAQWQKEKMMKDAVEATVKVDASGYPYIQAMELYDYTKDKPLAKEGDKVKLIFIKKD